MPDRSEGYDLTTPVVVANSSDFQPFTSLHSGRVQHGTAMLTLQPA